MRCPLHNDARRSAQVNFPRGKWFCHACDRGGDVAALVRHVLGSGRDPSFVSDGPRRAVTPGSVSDVDPDPLPSQAMISGWHSALMSHAPALSKFQQKRGLSLETVEAYEIGMRTMHTGIVYTLPIHDEDGQLVNVRFYDMEPGDERRKVWGLKGRNTPVLYPMDMLHHDRLVLCEGEWDALITIQNGIPAITRTGPARMWKSSWNGHFDGKSVFICQDTDLAGRLGARKVKRALASHAASVRIVKLPYPEVSKHGRDLTDYFHDDGHTEAEFWRMAKDSPEDMPPKPEFVDIELVSSFGTEAHGKIVNTKVTVAGRRDPPYLVPKDMQLSCAIDNGVACNLCPLQGLNGEKTLHLDRSDPVFLSMINVDDVKLKTVIRSHVGIPKCGRVSMEMVDPYSIEELIVRPSVESGHVHDGTYVSRRVFAVGGATTTQVNTTVELVGSVYPNPKDQKNEFMAHDLVPVKTSVDSFTMTPALHKDLQCFQASDELLMSKLWDIASNLSGITGIHGRPEMHLAMDLVYHSVLGFKVGGRAVDRGWMNLLVVGDTRTGKSETASRLVKFYDMGEMISCEGVSLAGLLGGLQQFGGKNDWIVTWGAIPMNDRRLVVLDEVGNLKLPDIEELSNLRSSGIAKIQKIQSQETMARTRLIWLGNPRQGLRGGGDKMDRYSHGVKALQPLIGKPEDIARFDLAMAVYEGDVSLREIHGGNSSTNLRQASCQQLLRWVWSRSPDQIVWSPRAEASMLKAAASLGQTYIPDPPLILAADVRFKLARIAVAIAGRTFSTDQEGQLLLVRPAHVMAAYRIINRLYGMPTFGYLRLSQAAHNDRLRAVAGADEVKEFVYQVPGLSSFMMEKDGHFAFRDMEDSVNIARDTCKNAIAFLRQHKMLKQEGPMYVASPILMQIVRELEDL